MGKRMLLKADDFTLVYHELPLAATWFVAVLIDFLPAKPSTGVHLERQVTWNSGTATYLITQRLRD